MRSLQECQAEIFRRSEIRIRKRRQRILATCIPLALCVTLTAVTLWPSEEKAVAFKAAGSLTLETAVSMEYSLAEVRVTGSGVSLCHTEPKTAEKVLALIEDLSVYDSYSYAVDEPEVVPETYDDVNYGTNTDRHWVVGGMGGDENNAGPTMAPPEAEATEYTLTFVYRDGSTEVYTLTGYQLKNTATGQTRYLTPEDAVALQTLLQLPEQ